MSKTTGELRAAKAVRAQLCIESECVFDRGCGCLDAITQALLAAQDAGLEMAAKVVDAECERILSKQSGAAAPALQAEVDKQIRMTAMMLPGVAEAVRALKARPDAGEEK